MEPVRCQSVGYRSLNELQISEGSEVDGQVSQGLVGLVDDEYVYLHSRRAAYTESENPARHFESISVDYIIRIFHDSPVSCIMRLSLEMKSSRTSVLPVARDRSASTCQRVVSATRVMASLMRALSCELTSSPSVCVFLANCLNGMRSSAWIMVFFVSFAFFSRAFFCSGGTRSSVNPKGKAALYLSPLHSQPSWCMPREYPSGRSPKRLRRSAGSRGSRCSS
jgi:hypothetical protein